MLVRYVIKKVLLAIPVLLGVAFVLFVITLFTPGDPAMIVLGERAPQEELAAMREALGLNKPWYIQYADFVLNALRGDLGFSYRSKLPVTTEIANRLPATAQLAAAAFVIASTLGVALGVLSAVKQNSWIDRTTIIFGTIFASLPVFYLGILLILVFSLYLNLLPASGTGDIRNLILPAAALGVGNAAVVARLTRSSMLEVLRQDYLRTARAKGLRESAVILGHAMRNAMIPVATVLGLQIGALLGGAFLTETVFAWPGIGRLAVQAIGQRDYPVLRGTVLLVAVTFVAVNLLLDILFVIIDPRIKYA